MITEPVLGSLQDFLTSFSDVPLVSDNDHDFHISELEAKHGLIQIADVLHFLHSDGQIVHCGVSPENIYIGQDGNWRMSGMGMCVPMSHTGIIKCTAYDYTVTSPPRWEYLSKPSLSYVAPEMASGYGQDSSTEITTTCDVFSFALVAYEAIVKRKLLTVKDEFMDYKSQIASMSQVDLSAVSPNFQYSLRMMLNPSPSSRPPPSAFSASPYFQEDKHVRALVFLDSLVQRDDVQKAAFLRDLDSFWGCLHARVIRYKVLPHLLRELQHPPMLVYVIPLLFRAVSTQSKDEFVAFTVPKLKHVLSNAKGEGLLTILKNVEQLAKLMNREMISAILFPMLVRAVEDAHPRVSEEALLRAQSLSKEFDYEPLKSHLLPRVHNVCLRTASAKVRINALVLLGALASRMDKEEAEKMLHTCAKISSVDKTPGTLMCVLGIGDAVAKQWGPEITAQKVLPLLCPLLVCTTLSQSQFTMYMTLIREMLQKLEDKRQNRSSNPKANSKPAATEPVVLERGWDSGPTSKTTWPSTPQSPATPTVPIVASGGSNSQLDTIDPFLLSLDTPSRGPAQPQSSTQPANTLQAGLLMDDSLASTKPRPSLGTWQQNPAPHAKPMKPLDARSLSISGTGAVGSNGSNLQMGGIGNFNLTTNLGGMSAVRPNSGTAHASGLHGTSGAVSFCDPSWQDPPLQSVVGNPTNHYSGGGLSSTSSHGINQGLSALGLNTGGFPPDASRSVPMNTLQNQNAFKPTQTSNSLLQHNPVTMGTDPFGGMSIELGDTKTKTQQPVTGDPFLDLLS